MKLQRLLAPLAAAAALLGGAQSAQAALILQVSSGSTTYTVADNGIGDLSGFAGSVLFFGSVGTWELTIASGTSATDPFSMHLTAGVTGTAGDAPITIKLTQTDLVAGSQPISFFANGSGSGEAGSAASWSAWIDDSNAAFGQGQQVESSTGYTSSADTIAATLNGTYSATIVTTVDFTRMTQGGLRGASLDVSMGVPEPTSLALVGLGLLGAGIARRRKAKA